REGVAVLAADEREDAGRDGHAHASILHAVVARRRRRSGARYRSGLRGPRAWSILHINEPVGLRPRRLRPGRGCPPRLLAASRAAHPGSREAGGTPPVRFG